MMTFRLAVLLAMPLAVSGCGGSSETPSILYKSAGSVQCSPTRTTQAQLNAEVTALQSAGVSVSASGCANDGMARAYSCGTDSGDLFSVTISAASVDIARQMGYRPASDYPGARPLTCQ